MKGKPRSSPDPSRRDGESKPPIQNDGDAGFLDAAFRFLPPPEEPILEFPPLELGEIDEDAPLAERFDPLWTSSGKKDSPEGDGPTDPTLWENDQRDPNSATGGKSRYRSGPFFHGMIPVAYRHLPFYALIPALILSRRGLSLIVSVMIHLTLFILLALAIFTVRHGSKGEPLIIGFSESEEIGLMEEVGESLEFPSPTGLTDPVVPELPIEIPEGGTPSSLTEKETAENGLEEIHLNDLPEPSGTSGTEGVATGPGIGRRTTSGRNAETRKHGLPGREGDTTDASEQAVEMGLAWLAKHQLPDGGWSFDLTASDDNGRPGSCQGRCENSRATSGGVRSNLYPSRTAATGIALLPFLGAGYDHQKPGVYQETVASGLEYLKYHAVVTDYGIDFREEGERYGMYTQSIVVLTICEAYELTGDPELKRLASEGLRLIVESQREDGGWRYEAVCDHNFFASIPGDTSVSGWQMLALKSGVSAGFDFPAELFYKVGYFLDSVGVENNSLYRYQARTREGVEKMWGTTSVGILMREYLGWGPDRREIKKGVNHLADWFEESYSRWKLAKRGREETKEGDPIFDMEGRFYYNLYFAYYASLALHHHGGKIWHRTFAATREFLIESQNAGSVEPHEAGSWLFNDSYMNDGGRLLNTALSVLILETPYRYLPMYQ